MPSTTRSRSTSRAASAARAQILKQLKDDHKRVKKAYREFGKLDREEDPQACQAIVQQVLDELTVHASLEEELLYPAARGAIADEDLIDEAEVEHESMHIFIAQLRDMDPEDEKYAARFTVLCEYVLHHVKEEEGEMFPQLERARLDWESLAAEIEQRRQELAPAEAVEDGEADAMAAESGADGEATAGQGGQAGARTSPRSESSRRGAEPRRSAEPRHN
jgi:hemerythrin superfamily protein